MRKFFWGLSHAQVILRGHVEVLFLMGDVTVWIVRQVDVLPVQCSGAVDGVRGRAVREYHLPLSSEKGTIHAGQL